MIIVLKKGATEAELQEIVSRIEEHHLSAHVSKGEETTVIGVVGIRIPPELPDLIERLPGVERTMRISKPYKLASREFKAENTVITIGDVRIGGGDVVIMAGPCSIESRDQLLKTAKAVKKAGAHVLRGGAFKPRTSPYSLVLPCTS